MLKHERQLLERITVNPSILNGKPIIRGYPLAVEQVLALLATGTTLDYVLKIYPVLDQEDILACLEYARRLVACMRLEGADLPVH